MRIHLVNPSHSSFGVAVITPRWLFVLAAATPKEFGEPVLVDECLDALDPTTIERGDVVGISIHTGNALRGYAVGKVAHDRGARVIYGGIHATLYPDEPAREGAADAVVKGDGDVIWGQVVRDCAAGQVKPLYDAGQIPGEDMVPARWDLIRRDKYMWASVQTVRGCPKHCSFCSVWRTDGQQPRQRTTDAVVGEVVELRRLGFRFIALADDNFYPVTQSDLAAAARRKDPSSLLALQAMREERLELMRRLAALPNDIIYFTQITMEAAEDVEFLEAMRAARIKGALVGVESITPEGLKEVYKGFNLSGDDLIARLRAFREHDIHVLGSFIFGLPSDRADTFEATEALATQADITFAQFVMLTPYPGTVDFEKWASEADAQGKNVEGVPISHHWLIPAGKRPHVYTEHPVMGIEEVRERTQRTWDRFYSFGAVWRRAKCVNSLKAKLAFILVSKLYRQMYANTGLSTDSARVSRSVNWARWMAAPLQKLFAAAPMPDLAVPGATRVPTLVSPRSS
ncbi:MAG: radical SAM protein [Acidobacteriota bacterium]